MTVQSRRLAGTRMGAWPVILLAVCVALLATVRTVPAQVVSAASDSLTADSLVVASEVQASEPPPIEVVDSAAVVFRGDTLWMIRLGLGPLSSQQRAALVSATLDSLVQVYRVAPGVELVEGADGTDVLIDSLAVATFTDRDARAAGISRDSLAALAVLSIQESEFALEAQTLSDLARGLLYTGIATAGLILALMLIAWLFPRLYTLADHSQSRWIRAIRIQRLEILSAARMSQGLTLVLRAGRVVLTVAVLYFFLPLVLSFFRVTSGISDQLIGWVTVPLGQAWSSFVVYLPNVFRIGVILGVMYYVLKLVGLVFEGLRTRRIRVKGFYTDWALPTYQIVRFLLIALTVIVIWPYLPMSDSPGFRGIAAFLGLLLTFGSASAIANMVGGIVLIYMRSFQIGDRVQISSTVGDVIEKGLLVTRIRTSKMVNVTIPNSMVLGDHLINYSRAAKEDGVILHTSITLGYDVPWRKVHEVLKGAADGVEAVMEDPEPFVLQTALDDFYVGYELNVYTRKPNQMAKIYSDLHERIQDACNEAGIEILSPHFRAGRDGNALQVPSEYLPKEA